MAGTGSLAVGAGALSPRRSEGQASRSPLAAHHDPHSMGTVGRIDTTLFDPMAFLRSSNFSDLDQDERDKVYRESTLPDGSTLREYDIFAVDREIEIAPGVYFPAWTYNGQVPGPTMRATEGDTVRIRFVNQGSHPHTIHFHGWHHPEMDGSCRISRCGPTRSSSTSSRPSRTECISITATPCR